MSHRDERTTVVRDSDLLTTPSETVEQDGGSMPDGAAGRYEFVGPLGQGGMGTVARVRDRLLRRDVALKSMAGLGPEWGKTFLEEAQITAQLEHPNIVPVHDLGGAGASGRYFTMKLVRGQTLRAWLIDHLGDRRDADRFAEALEIFLKVCDAVSFAHARGVVHGDIKPDNIMVGAFGEVHMMDWGLAHIAGPVDTELGGVEIERPAGSPRFGDGPLGTPSYMPPEQAVGRIADIDAQSDVFALGALLYHIVVGVPPFTGATSDEVVAAAREARFVRAEVATASTGVAPELARVIDQAMSPAKADRHPNVKALKLDVQRAMRGGTLLPRRWVPAGHVFFREGEHGSESYLLCEGRCVAYRTAPDGSKRVLREMEAGEVFGEMAVLSDRPRSATVEALEPVQVLVVSRELLEQGLGVERWLGKFVRVVVDRFHDLDARTDSVRGG